MHQLEMRMEFRNIPRSSIREEAREDHDELTDTDVREQLHEVINYHLVWDKPMKGLPKRFAMMSAARGIRGCGGREKVRHRRAPNRWKMQR